MLGQREADPVAIRHTVESDPFNLVAGALCLRDADLAQACISEYVLMCRGLREAGLTVLSPGNQQLVAHALSVLAGIPSADVHNSLGVGLEPPVPPTSPDLPQFPAYALTASSFGRESPAVPEGLRTQLDALGTKSAWEIDIVSAGLVLLASALLFHEARPPDMLEWIARMTRSDGLVGVWELIEDGISKANLLGTVNTYWGLHAALAPDVPLLPSIAREPAVSVSRSIPTPQEHSNRTEAKAEADEMAAALRRVLVWIDRHLDRFFLRPVREDWDEFSIRGKAFVELAVLCFALLGPRHLRITPEPPWCTWARGVSRRLSEEADWEGLIEAFRSRKADALALAAFPLLREVSGRASRFDEEAAALLRDPFAAGEERTPMRQMDFYFSLEMAGGSDEIPSIEEQLGKTLVAAEPSPLLLDRQALYDITHVVLYATRFGRLDSSSLGPARDWLRGHLGVLALACLMRQDADLGGELLLCQLYAEVSPQAEEFQEGMRMLLDIIRPSGEVPGPELPGDEPRETDSEPDEFLRSYHTTLVAAATFAESLARLEERSEAPSSAPAP